MTPQTPNGAYGIEAQIALERDSVIQGYQRFVDRLEKAKESGQAGESMVGQEIQYLLVGEVTGHIRAMIEQEAAPRRGRPVTWINLVRDLDPTALALEALSVGWSEAALNKPLSNTLLLLGSQAEVHAEFRSLAEVHGQKKAKAAVKAVVETKARVEGRRKAVAAKARKVGHKPWSMEDRVHVGGMLWNALGMTGLFETWTLGSDRDTKFVGLTPRGEQLALETTHALAWSRPVLLPTIVPPKPWEGLNKGAYYTKELQKRVTLVRTRSKDHRKALVQAAKAGDLGEVMRAVNAVQATSFSIRPEVLDLVKFAWKKGLHLKKFPSRDKVPVPDLPWDLEYMDIRQKAKILAQHYKVVRYNRGIVSNAAAMRRDLETADWLAGHPAFWLPHSLDFRGRIYPIPSFNHQRSDYVKAMFQFAQPRRLGAQGLRALKWHVANTGDFGKVSKKSWDDRVRWTEENLDLVFRVATNPQENLEWTRADKPFSFYHAALELHAALTSGDPENYESRIPVDLDGSNSGVQHYSAALRGEEGALVNLVPLDRPADVYGAVAVVVKAYAEKVAAPTVTWEGYKAALAVLEAAKAANNADLVQRAKEALEPLAARLWLDFGITRSEVKRPTMTRGYGSETFGFRSQIIEDLMEPLEVEVMTGKRAAHPFGADEGTYAASWMAGRIWEALKEILKKTSEGMDYLQAVASLLARAGRGVVWRTKLGFPVVQRYEEPQVNRVWIVLYDREAEVPSSVDGETKSRSLLQKYRVKVQTGTNGVLVKHRQTNAVAPNFIHSQDATHLLASVLRAADQDNIDAFLLVHDSFGTHAANIEVFGQRIREAFVDLYENHDPFQAFHEAAEAVLADRAGDLPPVPQKGSLDVQGVLQAAYAFS